MHIEFKLPYGSGGMAAGYRNMHLKKRLKAWADSHNVTIINWTDGHSACFEFARDCDYTLFALTWEVRSLWDEYEIV